MEELKNKRSRYLNKKSLKRRRLTFLIFVVITLISFYFVQESKRLIKIDYNNTSYIELIKLPSSSTKRVEDEKSVKNIIKSINSLRGTYVDSENRSDGEVSLLNIYSKDGKKIEFAKTDSYISVNGKWFRVGSRAIGKFDSIFASYYNGGK